MSIIAKSWLIANSKNTRPFISRKKMPKPMRKCWKSWWGILRNWKIWPSKESKTRVTKHRREGWFDLINPDILYRIPWVKNDHISHLQYLLSPKVKFLDLPSFFYGTESYVCFWGHLKANVYSVYNDNMYFLVFNLFLHDSMNFFFWLLLSDWIFGALVDDLRSSWFFWL